MVKSFSVSENTMDQILRLAKDTNKKQSDIIREAIEEKYNQHEWEAVMTTEIKEIPDIEVGATEIF